MVFYLYSRLLNQALVQAIPWLRAGGSNVHATNTGRAVMGQRGRIAQSVGGRRGELKGSSPQVYIYQDRPQKCVYEAPWNLICDLESRRSFGVVMQQTFRASICLYRE